MSGGARPEDARCPGGEDVRAVPAGSRGGGRALGRNPRRATSRAALGPGGRRRPPPRTRRLPAVGPGPQREAGARERPREPARRSPKPRSRAGRPAARRVPCGRRGARSGGSHRRGFPPPPLARWPEDPGGGCPGQVAASFPRPVPEAANGGGVRGPAESPGRAAPRTRFSFERMKGSRLRPTRVRADPRLASGGTPSPSPLCCGERGGGAGTEGDLPPGRWSGAGRAPRPLRAAPAAGHLPGAEPPPWGRAAPALPRRRGGSRAPATAPGGGGGQDGGGGGPAWGNPQEGAAGGQGGWCRLEPPDPPGGLGSRDWLTSVPAGAGPCAPPPPPQAAAGEKGRAGGGGGDPRPGRHRSHRARCAARPPPGRGGRGSRRHHRAGAAGPRRPAGPRTGRPFPAGPGPPATFAGVREWRGRARAAPRPGAASLPGVGQPCRVPRGCSRPSVSPPRRPGAGPAEACGLSRSPSPVAPVGSSLCLRGPFPGPEVWGAPGREGGGARLNVTAPETVTKTQPPRS